MKREWLVGLAAVFISVCVGAAEGPFDWPALPEREALQKRLTLKSQTGLLILERRCDLNIQTLTGVRREEFIRFLVLNESGVRGAMIDINNRQRARVSSIQARTVAPDGSITEADSKKDIHTVEVSTFKRREPLVSVATVNFPAPVPGALLDLHFVTEYEGATRFYADPVTFGQHPALKTDFDIQVDGGYPGTQWTVTLLGGRAGMGSLERISGRNIKAHFGLLVPGKDEPMSVPYFQRDTTLLAYIKWEFYDDSKSAGKANLSFDVDPRGRPINFTWQDVPMKGWWLKYFKEDEEAVARFIKKPGKAEDIPVEVLAPPQMPLEERLQKLYRYTQEHVGYSPDAKDLTSLGDVMREGENADWQGTLLFGYLLDRAGIPHTNVLITNRWNMRFSPLITNSYLYDMADAVFVDVPGKGRRFFMPGNLSLPYACLDGAYQDSLAFWTVHEKDLGSCFTPLNAPGTDRLEYRYEATLSPDGTLSGKMTVSQSGAPACDFERWYRHREYRKTHPSHQDKKKPLSPEEQKTELDKHLEEEASVPSNRADLTDFALPSFPASSAEPLQITCAFTEKSAAQPAQGGSWLVAALPLVAGYKGLFTEAARDTPIWYEKGARIVMDGTIMLPAGARIQDLPSPWEFAGPDGASMSFKVEAGDTGGAPAIKTHIEYDMPLVVGSDRYSSWKAYEAGFVSRGESRCVVSWPTSKVLE